MTATDDSVFASLQQVTGATYDNSMFNKDLIDIYMLRKARQKGLRLPTGGPPAEYKYLGAHVETSTAGTSENVVYIDVSSMYPSFILTLNASPETIIGTRADLRKSEYTEDDCVWGYIDTRAVKHLQDGEPWQQYTDGQYKMVYDPHAPSMKWSCDDGAGPRYEKCYFLAHDVQKGFLTECVEELIALKNQYRGTSLYGSTKRVTNCFTPDTEVMTPDGVVNIRDLTVGDEVYSFDPDTEAVEVKPVTETFAYPDYDDKLVSLQTTRIDFSVTPNHRMIVRKDNPSPNSTTWDEYKFVEAGDLEPYSHYELPHDWNVEHGDPIERVNLTRWLDNYEIWFDSEDIHGHTIRYEVDGDLTPSYKMVDGERAAGYRVDADTYQNNREYIHQITDSVYVHQESKQKWIPVEYDGDNFLQFLAWYITEGSSRVNGGDKDEYDTTRGYTHQVHLAQELGDDHRDIGDLLTEMGLTGYSNNRGYSLSSESLYTLLRDLCGEDSFDKQIPELVYDCSEQQKQLFFDTLIAGDGDSRETSHRYTTSSEQLRDDFMRLCVHLGRNPRYRKDSGSWRVFYSESKNHIQPNRSAEKDTADDGVYCVEVADNHTLLAGRNGNFQFVGQSIYGVLGFAAEESSFRLFDWRIAEAITLSGRKMIQFSRDYVIDKLGEMGYEAYAALGDTDGVGIAVPEASTRHEAMERVEDAVEQLNGPGYDQFFQQDFGVDPDNHHGEIEIESYAPKVFIPSRNPPHGDVGVKKRRVEWQTWNDDDGECDEISITGLEAERSDVAPITKQAQRAFAAQLRESDSTAREKLFPTLREYADAIVNGRMAIERVCKRGGIGQPLTEYGEVDRTPAPLYRGAKYASREIDGITVQQGDKPLEIRVTSVPDGYPTTYRAQTAEDGQRVDAIAVNDVAQLPAGFDVDWETHLQKTLIDPMKPLLETRFGADAWSEIRHGHEQQGLGDF